MRLFYLVVFLIFTSCAKKNQAYNSRLYLENMESFSPEFQAKIVLAIQKINQEAGGVLISLSQNEQNERPLVIINGNLESPLAHAENLEYRCLLNINQENTQINNSDPNVINLKYVMLHEIGHCYDLNHDNSSPYNIMNALYAGTENLTPGEISLVLNNLESFAKSLFQANP